MLVVAVVAEGVDQAQELDLQGDLRGTLTASIVSWEPCPLSATIGSPDEVVKEVRHTPLTNSSPDDSSFARLLLPC